MTIVFPEPGVCARIFPAALAALTDYYRDRGVEVVSGASVSGIERGGGRARRWADARGGLGRRRDRNRAEHELAAHAGLPVENGIVVDELGRVGGREDVFAAGDVARFPGSALGGRCGSSTRTTRRAMARGRGEHGRRDEPYEHLPFFYSDLFDLGYEAVGDLDPRQETFAEWKQPNRKGIVYYIDGERRPRGVLLWNLFDHVDDARDLIRAHEPIDSRSLSRLLG